MNFERLVQALANDVPKSLAEDLVSTFLEIRHDVATRTLGRVGAGKFVETVVQILQHQATGVFDDKPNVDDFLARRVENENALDDGLRICLARIARGAYALRSKRGIAHKGSVNPSMYDLRLLYAMSCWTIAELLRQSHSICIDEAGSLIDLVHAPLHQVVEEIDGHLIVHGNFTTKQELLVLLQSCYPDHMATDAILLSLQRRSAKSVQNRLRELFDEKLIHGSRLDGFRLTSVGYDTAVSIVSRELTKVAA